MKRKVAVAMVAGSMWCAGMIAAPAFAEDGAGSGPTPSTETSKPTAAPRPKLDPVAAMKQECAARIDRQLALAEQLGAKVAASGLTDAEKATLNAAIAAATQKLRDLRAALDGVTERARAVAVCEQAKVALASITVPDRTRDDEAKQRQDADRKKAEDEAKQERQRRAAVEHGVRHAVEGVSNSLDRLTGVAKRLGEVSARLAASKADVTDADAAVASMKAHLDAAAAKLADAKATLEADPTAKASVRDALAPVRIELDAARADAKRAVKALRAAAKALRDSTTSTTHVPGPDVTNGVD
jgi:chromosome segregation ATPase